MSMTRIERVDTIRKQVHIPRTVDTARARLLTQSYIATEGEPTPIRRGKALKKILSEMPIYIHNSQLLVGNQGERSRAGLIYPEFQWDITMNEMATWSTRPGDKFIITEDQQAELQELHQYWKGKTVKDRAWSVLPEEIKTSLKMGVISNANYLMSGHGHFIPDFEKVLSIGFEGIRQEVLACMERLNPASVDFYHKTVYYQGLLHTIDAVVCFANRYADLARELAEKETDSTRKNELLRIHENCRRVPRYPARDFWEAMQSIWFVQLIPSIEVNGLSICLGRMDQYLYPYYKKDCNDHILDDDRALELLDCFYLLTSTITKIYGNEGAMIFAGPGVGQTITLSGVDSNGQDATNELSYLFLEADAEVRLMQPDIAIRNHPLIPEKFLRQACRHTASGRDKPKFFTDRVVIQSLMNAGVPLEDARNFGDLGCSEIIVPGKSCSGGNMGNIGLIKCLEYSLSDGVAHWWFDGTDFHEDIHVQTGAKTGDAKEFTSFEEVLRAYEIQVHYFMDQMATLNNILDNVQAELVPHVFYSLVTEGCIQTGLDFTQGGAIYNYTSPLAVAPINVSDSLSAIKKLVFEENRLTITELLDAMHSNYAGETGEIVRQMLIKQAPKYGNGIDFTDELASYVVKHFADSMKSYENPRGGKYVPGVYSLTGNVGFGWRTGPTPDGRRGGEILNDNISPMQSMDLNGPTAVIQSLSKVDASLLPQGYVFNLKFTPNILDDEEKLQKFVNFNRALNDFGIFHVQYNVLKAEVLLAAQKDPQKHRDLLVRVSGYSAYFVELGRDVQEHLIRRTEHSI
ncbi:MAG: formate C-acetyltransferase/glycerol dehydratase family glycyl radical enzyme [Alphaproteobacteria bacterium]|nr:formate C-acetyltransferase/glycerol dehydratase family glycyl radical enzyme [Alphaproteobacteria bacterium]